MSFLTDFKIKVAAILAAVIMLAGTVVYAQLEGIERGVAPLASTGDFEVTGVEVDVRGRNAFDARKKGWEEAQRKAWKIIYQRTQGATTSGLSDDRLNSIVSAIIVEQEQIGPRRYIATLGVMFDRARAGSILGVGGRRLRSPPLLVLPIMWSGGAPQVFENRTEWQKAWARFQSGDSAIDYVRPYGTDSESLVLTAGQADRPSRRWWRNILDQFGAADVIIPMVRLNYDYPGGPVEAHFTARYGPDNRYIESFTLKVDRSEDIPKMLDQGVGRLDNIYSAALSRGILKTDKSLIRDDPFDIDDLNLDGFEFDQDGNLVPGGGDEESSASVVEDDESQTDDTAPAVASVQAPVATTSVSLQFDTPDVGAVGRAETLVRVIPGVTSASTSSLALGGVSVMNVTYRGDISALAQALRGQGWQVQQGAGVIRISRSGQ
ncbi:heavy-metal-associated domain-containing protein [Parasphingorhabdus sp.]|uniref:heavy-metal-associated domain-containing protein n=1 Tax=Parasphingorhabdus sp. TaxID=2709688 RepID=UPI00326400FF